MTTPGPQAYESSPGGLSVVALGSNLGDRRAMLEDALRRMETDGLHVLERSRLYETKPWGGQDQPPYLNAAVLLRSDLPPLEILPRLQAIEAALGRDRSREKRWGARTLDLDLLWAGGARLETPELTLPHPRLTERDFVLAPLIDLGVEPDPVLAPRGWQALLDAIPAEQRTIFQIEPWKRHDERS